MAAGEGPGWAGSGPPVRGRPVGAVSGVRRLLHGDPVRCWDCVMRLLPAAVPGPASARPVPGISDAPGPVLHSPFGEETFPNI